MIIVSNVGEIVKGGLREHRPEVSGKIGFKLHFVGVRAARAHDSVEYCLSCALAEPAANMILQASLLLTLTTLSPVLLELAVMSVALH